MMDIAGQIALFVFLWEVFWVLLYPRLPLVPFKFKLQQWMCFLPFLPFLIVAEWAQTVFKL